MEPTEFSALVRQRHSVRDFLPEPIPEDVVEAILDDARHAPSWSNTRPYCVAAATGAQLDRLREAYVRAFDASLDLQHKKPVALLKAAVGVGVPDGDFKAWKPYPAELRPRSAAVGKGLYTHMGVAREDREGRDGAARRNCEFFGAPLVLWFFVHKGMLPFSAHDGGLMLQTLMLAAQARGVSSCAIGTLAVWRHPLDEEFEIPEDYKLLTGLALGYASTASVNEFRAEHPPLTRVAAKANRNEK